MPSDQKLPDTLTLVLVLLPGFVSEGVVRYYHASPKLSEVETVASALIFTLVDLALVLAIWRLSDVLRNRDSRPLSSLVESPVFLISLILVAMLAGGAWAVVDQRNLVFRILPLTERASRADVWDRAFQMSVVRGRKHIVVRLTDGGVYSGVAASISEGESEAGIFLQPAFVEGIGTPPASRAATSPRCAIAHGLLVPKASIQLVAFRDPLPYKVDRCSDVELTAAFTAKSLKP